MRTLVFVLLATGLFLATVMLALLFMRPSSSASQPPPPELASTPPKEATPPPPLVPAEAPPVEAAKTAPAKAPAPETAAVQAEFKISYQGLVQQAADAAPIAGARVVFLNDEEAAAEAVSDETGAYRLEVTLQDWEVDDFTLTCEAKGYARLIRKAEDLGTHDPGAEIRYDFGLNPGSALSGRITEALTGAPVPDVTVRLRPRESGINEERFRRRSARTVEAVSDAEGNYAFESLGAGPMELSVDSGEQNLILSETDTRMLNVAPKSSQELDLVLEAGALVRGTVSAAGGELPEEVHVVLLREQAKGMMTRIMEAAEAMQQGRQDVENGEYTVDGLRFDTKYRLRATAEGFAATKTEEFSIAPGRSPLVLDIELVRGSSILGRVQYSDGSPAPDQRVMSMPDFGSLLSGDLPESDMSAKTDEKGAFTIAGLLPGKYNVMAGQPSFPFGGGDNAKQVEVDGVNNVSDVVLEIDKPAEKNTTPKDGKITGKVVDQDNAPVANAKVQAKIFGVQVKAVNTDDDGSFTIAELDDVKYDLAASSDDGEGEAKQVAVGSEVTIQLAGATQVSGVVVDANGDPVAQCGVKLEKEAVGEGQTFDPEMFQNMIGMGGKGGTTDDFGYFAFKHVSPGKYIVKAVATGRGSGESESFEVSAGKTVDNLKITMEAGVLFSGKVVDSTGKGVEGVELALYMTGGGSMFQEQMAQFMPQGMQQATMSGFSEAQGAFTFQGVPPGPYRLGATHADYARTVVKDLSFIAGHDLINYEVIISAGGCLSGVPIMRGESRKGLMVQAIGENGMEMSTTDDKGAFEICGLSPGRYMIQVMDMNSMMSGDFASMMPVQRSAEVRENETTIVEFGTAEGATVVTGTVTGNIGTMTTITLRDPGSPAPSELNPFDMAGQIDLMEQMGGNAILGPDGTFTMENVKPGEYILEVYSFNFDMALPNMQELMDTARTPRVSQNVTISAGETPHFDLEIPAE